MDTQTHSGIVYWVMLTYEDSLMWLPLLQNWMFHQYFAEAPMDAIYNDTTKCATAAASSALLLRFLAPSAFLLATLFSAQCLLLTLAPHSQVGQVSRYRLCV